MPISRLLIGAAILAVLPAVSGCSMKSIAEACAESAGADVAALDENATTTYVACMARAGSREAQYLMGQRYETGTGAEQDYEQAAEWYRSAALSRIISTSFDGPGRKPTRGYPITGLSVAQFALGRLYATGEGVEQNPRKARKWLHRAASAGHRNAAEWLAWFDAGGSHPDSPQE